MTSSLRNMKISKSVLRNMQAISMIFSRLPPQVWHEAAFTRIAGVWGEVVFPEKCLVTNNNLVAGKVCIHTKCMELIQVSMPVIIDEVHVCIRIREIPGECDEIFKPETSIVKDSYDDSTTSHGDDLDTQDDDEDEDEDDDEDDLFDDNYKDDTDNELFLNGDADYLMHDGGWIREDGRVVARTTSIWTAGVTIMWMAMLIAWKTT
ncbi:hypothetical protein Tco_1276275 [Tanacetum coccineum]